MTGKYLSSIKIIQLPFLNEKYIKTSIRIYFRPMYDVNVSGIDKLNNSMTKDKYNILVNSVHSSWCDHLVENNDNNYDM